MVTLLLERWLLIWVWILDFKVDITMNMIKHWKVIGLMLSCTLIGCGSDSQDNGQVDESARIQLSGVLVAGGQNARATIFKDTNGNGILDTFEEYAKSDDEGYFSKNPNTGIDYCVSGPENLCLEVFFSGSEEILRVVGGYDSSTGNPFSSTMSRVVKISNIIDQNRSSRSLDSSSSKFEYKTLIPDLVVSPLTTLVSSMTEDEASTLLNNEGITEADLDINYLENDNSGAQNTKLLNRAIKIQKVIEVASSAIETHFESFGDHEDLPNDASGFVYESLAKQLSDATQGTTLNEFFGTPGSLKKVLSGTDDAVKLKVEVINQDDESDPIDKTTGLVDDLPMVSDAIDDAGIAINNLIESVLADADAREFADKNEQKSAVNLIESLSLIAKEINVQIEDEDDDTTLFIQNLGKVQTILEATNSDGDNAAEVLIKSSFDDEDLVDISTFATSVSEAESPTADITTLVDSAVLNSDATLPLAIGGTKLLFSRRPSGIEVEAGDMAFYFSIDPDDANNGEVSTCLRYKENAVTGEDDSSDSEGVLLTGTWTRWNENTILLDLVFAQIGRSYFIKSIGELPVDISKFQYRFDYNGRVNDWLAETANRFLPFMALPDSDDSCKTLLTQDIGNWPY
jgi:hypothetical protein